MTKISDVARGAGVSTSTVSNFLNSRCERMRSETREWIEKAIAQLAYRPNTAARQLKKADNILCTAAPIAPTSAVIFRKDR